MNSFIFNFRKQWPRVFSDLLAFVFLLFLFDRLFFLAIKKSEAAFFNMVSPYSLADKFSGISNKQEYKVLILGTSRTYEGIHPQYIWNLLGIKAFKESFVGKGPMYNYFFYQTYKKYMGVPRVVVYGLDYFMFSVKSERQWMKRFDRQTVDSEYYSSGWAMLWANKPQIDGFLNTLLNYLQTNFSQYKNFLIERDNQLMQEYIGKTDSKNIDPKEPPRFRKLRFPKYPGKEGEYFSKLLAELQRDGVTVLLISLPEYIGTYETNMQQRKFIRTFNGFCKTFKNVHFIDYNNKDILDRFDSAYFIDGGYGKANSHLSQAGAEILNLVFVKDLGKYLPRQ
jgi:hypothetical protein